MDPDLCRICLGTNNLFCVFDTSEGDSIASKIMMLCSFEFKEDDGLPKFVCGECVQKVDAFLDFKKQIEVSHECLLRSIKLNSEEDGIKGDDAVEYVEYLEVGFEHEVKSNDEPEENNSHVEAVEITPESPHKSTSRMKEPIQCTICGKLISTKFRLKCHMRTHTGEKPYHCSLCGKSFALSYNLKIHERIHTGEKPFECQVCSKKFAQATGLISHLRMHTGENPYKCHLCPKGFKTVSHLKYHIRIHTGEKNFVCSTCKKAFITKSDLSQHMKTHTGEKPHTCTICGMRLSRAYHLERHMITHTGERKFKCDICGQSYAQNYDLRRHKARHGDKTKPRGPVQDDQSENIILELLIGDSIERSE